MRNTMSPTDELFVEPNAGSLKRRKIEIQQCKIRSKFGKVQIRSSHHDTSIKYFEAARNPRPKLINKIKPSIHRVIAVPQSIEICTKGTCQH